jgi:hypothetical protein
LAFAALGWTGGRKEISMQSKDTSDHHGDQLDRHGDWFDQIVGNSGSNVGMARILGAILAFILVFGSVSWLIG